MKSKTRFFHNLTGVILFSLFLAFFVISVVFFILGIKTKSINYETGKDVYVESYVLTFGLFGFLLTPAMFLAFIVYLIVFEVNKKKYRLAPSQEGTALNAINDSSVKKGLVDTVTSTSSSKDQNLLYSYIDNELLRYKTVIRIYLFGSKSSLISIAAMMLLFMGLSFIGGPTGDSVSVFLFYFCLIMSGVCFLFLLLLFTLIPCLTVKNNNKNSDGQKIRIYDDRIEMESMASPDKNSTIKQATVVLYFASAKNAKETKDCFFFITGSKPRTTFYIGKGKGLGEKGEDFLSRKTKEIRDR